MLILWTSTTNVQKEIEFSSNQTHSHSHTHQPFISIVYALGRAFIFFVNWDSNNSLPAIIIAWAVVCSIFINEILWTVCSHCAWILCLRFSLCVCGIHFMKYSLMLNNWTDSKQSSVRFFIVSSKKFQSIPNRNNSKLKCFFFFVNSHFYCCVEQSLFLYFINFHFRKLWETEAHIALHMLYFCWYKSKPKFVHFSCVCVCLCLCI